MGDDRRTDGTGRGRVVATAGHAALVVVTIDCQKCGQPFPQAVNSPQAIRPLCRHCRRIPGLTVLSCVREGQPPRRGASV